MRVLVNSYAVLAVRVSGVNIAVTVVVKTVEALVLAVYVNSTILGLVTVVVHIRVVARSAGVPVLIELVVAVVITLTYIAITNVIGVFRVVIYFVVVVCKRSRRIASLIVDEGKIEITGVHRALEVNGLGPKTVTYTQAGETDGDR
jgi:hypothetical protein